MLTVQAAAEYLALSPETLNADRWRGTLGIPYVRLGRAIRYRTEDLEGFLADHVQRPVKVDLVREPSRRRSGQVVVSARPVSPPVCGGDQGTDSGVRCDSRAGRSVVAAGELLCTPSSPDGSPAASLAQEVPR